MKRRNTHAAKAKEPGFAEWKELHGGKCAVCGQRGALVRHHIVSEAHVRAEGGDPWDLRNALDVGRWCNCHARHHLKVKRIPMDKVPDAAIDFARELYGKERATMYFARHYGPPNGGAA